jgi:acetylglutamate kinase
VAFISDLSHLQSVLQTLKGKRLVVKLGGEVMLNARGLDALASEVALLSAHGVGVLVVHGGGPQADSLAQRLGHTVHKVAGRRITDDDALEVAKMVYAGSLNVELLAVLRRHGARGVGLSGVDATLITVTRRPITCVTDPKSGKGESIDFGHVGEIASVDIGVLELLLNAGYVPVVASLAADAEGNVYNVNADTVAQALAVALRAERLVLVTDVPGILADPTDPGSLLQVCDPEKISALIEAGAISGGMLPKVHNSLEALRAGVVAVQILDGSLDHPPLLESLVGPGIGTLVVGSKQMQ